MFRLAVVDPALRGALALALVALVGAGGAVWFAWEHRPGSPSAATVQSAPTTGAVGTPTAVRPTPTRPPTPAVTTGATSDDAVIVVDVAGLVAIPGVVTLSPGARVVDALELAGGVLPGTDTTGLSLARPLVDGEQVFVDGRPGPAAPAVGAGPPGASAGGVGGAAGPAAPVNLNTATVGELDALPGVGPVLAQRIIDWREAHGGFTSTDQLGEVSGMGDKRLAELLPLVTV